MAVCEIHFGHVPSLNKMTSATVILPENKPGPFPVLYLLHGLADDHTSWTRRTSVERYVQDLPLIVVLPNGDRSFYLDAVARPNFAYETYLTRDLLNFVDATFQTIPHRAGRALAGLSMGGYGALSLALKHPDLYCAAASFSGAVQFGRTPLNPADGWGAEFLALLGASSEDGPNDLQAVVESGDPATRPLLRLDCGVDDFLIEHNREFAVFLAEKNVPHEYVEYPGAHDWGYWDAHIQDALPFLSKALSLPGFK